MRLSLPMMALALLTAAFLWPVEDSPNGRGLHFVVLWLVLAMLHALRMWRERVPDSESRRAPFGLIDFGVLLIVAGHVVSTIIVFQVEGDRRSALNLTFEWAGLFAAWRMFRSLCLDRLLASQVATVVVAMATGLATFGIWQHHVFYPEQAAWYQEKRDILDQAISGANTAGMMQASEITSQFQSEGIPMEGGDRILWENRLLSSSEPFATFSLANTLAGVLAASLVLMIGQASSDWVAGHRLRIAGIAIFLLQIGLITYCLILTKSRSAWAGAIFGLLVLAIVRSRASTVVKAMRWSIVSILVFSAIAVAGAFGGALDKEVILESPQSLQYRLFYWSGTLGFLKEHPLAGAGPGNFRQLYLPHKADESSEEIRDPHNFVLESWTSGGALGLLGMLLFVGCFLRRLATVPAVILSESPSPTAGRVSRRTVPGGLLLGFALHAGWEWIQGNEFPMDEPARVLLAAGVVLVLIQNRRRCMPLDAVSGLAAGATMVVHLLAAGGFEMPAVMLLLLVCAAMGVSHPRLTVIGRNGASAQRRWFGLPVSAICLGVAVVVCQFGLRPVMTAGRFVQAADAAVFRQHNPAAALSRYEQAAQSDPLAVTPRQRIAELETYRLKELAGILRLHDSENGETNFSSDEIGQIRSSIEKSVPKALEACEFLLSADRRSCVAYRLRASILATGAEVLNNPEMLADAIEEQQRVVTMYPSSVADWFQLASLCTSDQTGAFDEMSREAARRALELDEINHHWGHRDRYLEQDQRDMLKQLDQK